MRSISTSRTPWAAATVIPIAVVVGFLIVLRTPLGGWGYLVGPLLAAVGVAVISGRAESRSRPFAIFGLAALAGVVTMVVMGIVAVLTVLLLGL